MSNKQLQVIAKETVYQGFFRLEKYRLKHTLFQGGWSNEIVRELFRRGDCVAVLLYDPVRDEVVLIEQFRIGAVLRKKQAWLLEIVAGAVEPGETAAEVAIREAEEEAGCKIQELRLIHEFYTTPGGASEWLSLFYGRIDSRNVGGIFGLDHEDEDIRVSAVKFEQAYQMMEQGEIDSAIPIIALQWLYIHRPALRS
ncbi:NUDIX domain-containing protein [methane-oxidizing endosymbiont of Gigantopelta aegis]|uniref:NUDIX domain-containing protein n=1 Tax=methane-oxidizing endosymbiont of Gigantopelta aegis TaxID=2794938 RepID=UPI0018DB27D9|nr:NUDIX domain-containing protein [methane-oxidizing endosymbiont of Gigantopelta aegis]